MIDIVDDGQALAFDGRVLEFFHRNGENVRLHAGTLRRVELVDKRGDRLELRAYTQRGTYGMTFAATRHAELRELASALAVSAL